MENLNNELISNLIAFLAILIPSLLAGVGLREILTKAETNRTLEKAWDSIPPSAHKETIAEIIALADRNAEAVVAIVERHNEQIAAVLRELTWALNYVEDVTDGEDEGLPEGGGAG